MPALRAGRSARTARTPVACSRAARRIEARFGCSHQRTLAYGAGAIVLVLASFSCRARREPAGRRLASGELPSLAEGHFGLRMASARGSDVGRDLGRRSTPTGPITGARDAEIRRRGPRKAAAGCKSSRCSTRSSRGAHLARPSGEPRSHPRPADVARSTSPRGDSAPRTRRSGQPEIPVAHRGLRPSYAANPVPLRTDEGHSGQALKARRPLLLSEQPTSPRTGPGCPMAPRVGSILLIPILSKGRASARSS
jgi:hypothetical protein